MDQDTIVMAEAEGDSGKKGKAAKKADKAAKKAAAAEKKAMKAGKKAAKAEKKAAKADKKEAKVKKSKKAKKETAPSVITTKKAMVFGNPIRNLIITAVVSALMGAAFLVKPAMLYTYCGYAVGGAIALIGVVYIIIYFARKMPAGVYRCEFAIGLVALLAGAYVALNGLLWTSVGTVTTTWTFTVRLLGVLVALDGILKLQYSLDVLRMGYKKWWVGLITAIIGIALGVLTVLGLVEEVGASVLTSLGFGTATVAGGAAAGGAMGPAGGAAAAAKTTTSTASYMAIGVMFCLNALMDVISLIVVALRNHKANKAVALAEAEKMMASAAPEAVTDFFPGVDTSAAENAPSAEVSTKETTYTAPNPVNEPVWIPEPKRETTFEPAIVFDSEADPEPQAFSEPEPEPESEPVFEPELPDPELASPADEKE